MTRACADCELELGILDRTDSTKTHGQCKRHFIKVLLDGGHSWEEIQEGLKEVGPNGFCDDLKAVKIP